MRYLKPHPINENSGSKLQKIMDEIENSVSGQDLKALCDFDPKRSGRIFVKPKGLPGSKTYIEKDTTGGYIIVALSNGVPMFTERYQDTEEAFINLWSYIISRNKPSTIPGTKKDLRNWVMDPANGLVGAKKEGKEIIEIYRSKFSTAGMATIEDFFQNRDLLDSLRSIGIEIQDAKTSIAFRLSRNEEAISIILDERNPVWKALRGILYSLTKNEKLPYPHMRDDYFANHIMADFVNRGLVFTVNNYSTEFRKNNYHINAYRVGCLKSDVGKVEMKLLSSFKRIIKDFIKRFEENPVNYSFYMGDNDGSGLYKICNTLRIQMLKDCLKNLELIISGGSVQDNKMSEFGSDFYDKIAQGLSDKDVLDVVGFSEPHRGEILKRLGVSDKQASSIAKAKDIGIF